VSQLTLYNASSLSPTDGARLWAKPQSQHRRTKKRVGVAQRLLTDSRGNQEALEFIRF